MRYFTACLSVFYLALTLVKDGFIMFFLMGHLFTWVKRLPWLLLCSLLLLHSWFSSDLKVSSRHFTLCVPYSWGFFKGWFFSPLTPQVIPSILISSTPIDKRKILISHLQPECATVHFYMEVLQAHPICLHSLSALNLLYLLYPQCATIHPSCPRSPPPQLCLSTHPFMLSATAFMGPLLEIQTLSYVGHLPPMLSSLSTVVPE